MNKYFMSIVFVALTFSGCGRGPVGAAGPAGQSIQGPAGVDGTAGDSCTVTEMTPSSVYPNGGAVVLCGASSVVIKNGADGTNGNDGQNGYDAIADIIDPCGDAPGIHDEVLVRLSNLHILASMSENANGNNTRFVLLTPSNYVTTDGSGCHFTVNADGTVTSN